MYTHLPSLKKLKADVTEFFKRQVRQYGSSGQDKSPYPLKGFNPENSENLSVIKMGFRRP
jgi:hypothetical protein